MLTDYAGDTVLWLAAHQVVFALVVAALLGLWLWSSYTVIKAVECRTRRLRAAFKAGVSRRWHHLRHDLPCRTPRPNALDDLVAGGVPEMRQRPRAACDCRTCTQPYDERLEIAVLEWLYDQPARQPDHKQH